MAAVPLTTTNNWTVCVRARSDRRGTKRWPAMSKDDAPALGDEPVMDLLPADEEDFQSSSAVVAVAISDITGEILTADARESGASHEVVRFEYDQILSFSSNEDDLQLLTAPTVDRVLTDRIPSTLVSYGRTEDRSLSMWGTPLEVDGDDESLGRVTVRRHGGIFLRSVAQLLTLMRQQAESDGANVGNGRNVSSSSSFMAPRLSCSFLAVDDHEMHDLLAPERVNCQGRAGGASSRKTPSSLRAIASDRHTEVAHLTEHPIDDVGAASLLLTRAFESLDGRTMSREKQETARSQRQRRALKVGPSSSFRRPSIIVGSMPDVIVKIHADRGSTERTTLTLVDMSSSGAGAPAFLRCVSEGTSSCRDSLLTLVLKSTFASDTGNLFLAHLDCSGGEGSSSKIRTESENKSDLLKTLRYTSRVLQSQQR